MGKAFGIGIAALLLIGSPAEAELMTVPANEVVTTAKPLQAQKVNKGRIWLLFVLGASTLFGATILLENNEAWFPAISRANRAMAASMKAAKIKEEKDVKELDENNRRLSNVESERLEDARLEGAVMTGLEEARRPSSGSDSDSTAVHNAAQEDEGVLSTDTDESEALFEIGSDDIAASFEKVQQMSKERVLENLSLEELQKEIVERKSRGDDSLPR